MSTSTLQPPPSASLYKMTEGDLNPTTPEEHARLRGRLLGLLEDLSNETNEDTRLRAILGGLRALAQIESLKIRQQRADQNERALDLAERHLALNERKFECTKTPGGTAPPPWAEQCPRTPATLSPASSPIPPQPRSGETAVAPGVRSTDNFSGAPQGRHTPAPEAPTTPDPDPLNPQELTSIKGLYPELDPVLFRQPTAANIWRKLLRTAFPTIQSPPSPTASTAEAPNQLPALPTPLAPTTIDPKREPEVEAQSAPSPSPPPQPADNPHPTPTPSNSTLISRTGSPPVQTHPP